MALEPLPFRGLSPPPGFAMSFFASPLSPPLGKGLNSRVTKRLNGIKRKGTQSPSSQRRPAFSVVGVKNMANPEGAQA